MMGFLEKFEAFIKTNFKIDLNINILNNIKIFSDNKKKNIIQIDSHKNLKSINLTKFTSQQKETLFNILKSNPQGTLYLKEKSDKFIKGVHKSLKKQEKLIEFFSDKIPPEDLMILKSAIVIRSLHEENKKEAVSIHKRELAMIYGKKANTISNLCTAGYFETILQPVYDKMSAKDNFVKEDFQKFYREMIDDFPVAIFVSRYYTVDKLYKEIRERIKENIYFGIKYLNIHGIGDTNIEKIDKVLSKLKKSKDYTTLQTNRDDITGTIKIRLGFD